MVRQIMRAPVQVFSLYLISFNFDMTKKVLEIEHVELKSVSIRYVYAKKTVQRGKISQSFKACNDITLSIC